MFQSVPTAPGELQISEKMANAITGWLLAFYQRPAWLEAGYRVTNAPINVTDYMSTLACNEIAMSAGASARGTWINDQLTRFLLPQLKNAVQLAGAGGRVVVKPYPSGRNIYCEIIPADRIYPTRINGAGVTEAGFFTDFAALRGRKVVRVEAWDLQPDGLYLQNRAYWYNTGDTLGGELALTDVPEWAGLEPEVVIRGVDRPLFGELRMPMANTVDETSKLPVSLYARAVDTMAELDRIYSEFLWEIHTGKRKRIVDRTAIKPDKSGGGVPFRDQTTDLYLSMDLTGDMGQGDPFRDYGGGAGGGAAHGKDGEPGSDSPTAVGGAGASPDVPKTPDKIGAGGNGGHGGGGGGGAGGLFASAEAYGPSELPAGIWITKDGGSAGKGSPGSNGGPGGVILYFGVRKKLVSGPIRDKSGRALLDRLGRRLIV